MILPLPDDLDPDTRVVTSQLDDGQIEVALVGDGRVVGNLVVDDIEDERVMTVLRGVFG